MVLNWRGESDSSDSWRSVEGNLHEDHTSFLRRKTPKCFSECCSPPWPEMDHRFVEWCFTPLLCWISPTWLWWRRQALENLLIHKYLMSDRSRPLFIYIHSIYLFRVSVCFLLLRWWESMFLWFNSYLLVLWINRSIKRFRVKDLHFT